MCGNRLGLIIIHGFGHHPAPLLGYLHGNQRKFRNQYESGAPPHCAAGAVLRKIRHTNIRENGNESSAETSPTNCHLFPQNQAVLAVVPQSDARIR